MRKNIQIAILCFAVGIFFAAYELFTVMGISVLIGLAVFLVKPCLVSRKQLLLLVIVFLLGSGNFYFRQYRETKMSGQWWGKECSVIGEVREVRESSTGRYNVFVKAVMLNGWIIYYFSRVGKNYEINTIHAYRKRFLCQRQLRGF